jgi:hypothetical protein
MLQSLNTISASAISVSPVSSERTAAVGLAVGNHAIKLSTAQQDYVIRSQSLSYHPDLVSGTDSLLLGEAISTDVFTGKLAVGENLDTYNGVQTLGHGLKGELYARYALIAIAHAVENGAAVNLAVSLPTSRMRPLIEPLQGTHTVLVNSRRKEFRVSGIAFFPEGLGAATRMRELKMQRSPQPVPSFAALDFGGGNCSIVGLDADGAVAGFAQTTPGVMALYGSIAAAVAAGSGGIAPTDDAIRLGVEAQTYRVGGYGQKDFKAIYDELLPQWISSQLSEIRAKAGDILDKSAVKVVCGGGAKLPGLMAHLPSDYAHAASPQQLESQGLLEFARRICVDAE